MAETTTSRKTRVVHPTSVKVANEASGRQAPSRRSRRRGAAKQTDEGTLVTDALLNALASDDNIEIVDDFDLMLDTPAPAHSTRRSRRRADEDVEVEVDVAADEHAVLLLESDGVYVWNLPTRRKSGGRRRRGAAPMETLSFTMEIGAAGERRISAGRRGLVDWFSRHVVGRVRTIVVKFVAGKAVGAAQRYLERNIKPGLIAVQGTDSGKWVVGDTPPAPSFPAHQPVRVLLMIHGTFSTTRGSFGALAKTPEGKAFLGLIAKRYDAVLAFDHATLGAWPEENAKDIFAALKKLNVPAGSSIDVVAYSRGGLVARVLTEELLPNAGGPLKLGKAVFVGCTNGGTALADQQNWKTLLDLMTNISMAAGKGLAFLGAGVASAVISQTVQTLGTFMQAVVDAAVTEEMVPGIAAMAPKSKLVTRLNDPARVPIVQAFTYFALGSNFEPDLFASNASSPLSKRLLRALADLGIDGLMNEDNDLVVDTEAMSQFGVYAERLADHLLFEENATIFHTNYFAQAEIVERLGGWLLHRDDDPGEVIAVAEHRAGAQLG